MRHWCWPAINALLGFLQGCALLFLLFLGGSTTTVAWRSDTPQALADTPKLLRWGHDTGRYWTGTATLVLTFASIGRKMIGPRWIWAGLQRLLDRWRDSAVGDRDGELHAHRVTLFRARRWGRMMHRWPWHRVLIPVVRSGHMTQSTAIYWPIPDDGSVKGGIAGITFAKRAVVSVDGLPDVSGSPTAEEVASYAIRTGVPEDWVRAQKPRARSFYGTPVEISRRVWGVVVIDSRDPYPIGQRQDPEFKSHLTALSVLLERRSS